MTLEIILAHLYNFQILELDCLVMRGPEENYFFKKVSNRVKGK